MKQNQQLPVKDLKNIESEMAKQNGRRYVADSTFYLRRRYINALNHSNLWSH